MKAVLTIAGSDSSGGAGIQADLKTIAAHHLFGESVITALTAQNTLGVTDVLEVDPVFVGTQIDAVFDDIRPDAVKIGMVSSAGLIQEIAEKMNLSEGTVHAYKKEAYKKLRISLKDYYYLLPFLLFISR